MDKRAVSKIYQKGEESFVPGKEFVNIYPDDDYQKAGYYYKCGWQKSFNAWEEEKQLKERPHCPVCFRQMNQFQSGMYCEDEETCRYHTHDEGE